MSAQQAISIDGSTGSTPLVEALGKAFSVKRGITVQVGRDLGTKARFEALSAGRIDTAMASHGRHRLRDSPAGRFIHVPDQPDIVTSSLAKALPVGVGG